MQTKTATTDATQSWPVWCVQIADGPKVRAKSEDDAYRLFHSHCADSKRAVEEGRRGHGVTLYCNWHIVRGA